MCVCVCGGARGSLAELTGERKISKGGALCVKHGHDAEGLGWQVSGREDRIGVGWGGGGWWCMHAVTCVVTVDDGVVGPSVHLGCIGWWARCAGACRLPHYCRRGCP